MSEIKFISINAETRTATFGVNGKEVTRSISQETTDETLAEHLRALARGLAVELEEQGMKDDNGVEISNEKTVNVVPTLTITEPFAADEVVFEGTANDARIAMEEVVAEE